MKNEFSGSVSGVYKIDNCVLCASKRESGVGNIFSEGEVMRSYYGKEECVAVSEDKLQAFLSDMRAMGVRAEVVCRCTVVRVFGIGLGGGGVLCRSMGLFGELGLYPLGLSVSECGLAFAFREGAAEKAFAALSQMVDERGRT